MAQTFKINGTSLSYITQAEWGNIELGQALDGGMIIGRWRQHILSTNVMSASEFNTFYALQGQRVTLTTTDYDTPNSDYKTYYEAIFETLEGLHDGPVFLNVQARFRVRL